MEEREAITEEEWAALNKFVIWKSDLLYNLKRRFLRATEEAVLIYGAVAWTLTKILV